MHLQISKSLMILCIVAGVVSACGADPVDNLDQDFPQTLSQLDSYPTALMAGEVEILKVGESYCPTLTDPAGEKYLLVLPPTASIESTRIIINSDKSIPKGTANVGGGQLDGIEYHDAGCTGTSKAWLVAP